MGVACHSSNLALQFAIARGIDVGERRSYCHERLRVGDPARGSKNAQKFVTFAPDAAEHPHFLQNHGPGDGRKEKKKKQNAAGDPAGLGEDISNIGSKNRGEQKNGVPLSEKKMICDRETVNIFLGLRNVAHASRARNQ